MFLFLVEAVKFLVMTRASETRAWESVANVSRDDFGALWHPYGLTHRTGSR
jgi:hypothetical protein